MALSRPAVALVSALVALPLVALPACGRDESRRAGGDQGDSFFPLVPGSHWRYALSTSQGSLQIEVTAKGEEALPRDGRVAFVMDERSLGPSLGFDEVAPVAYVIDEGYVGRIHDIGYDGSGKLRALGQNHPTWILPLAPRTGASWDQQNVLFENPEGEGARMQWGADVGALVSLTVPAGSFDGVIEIVSRYYDAATSSHNPKVIYRDYYARGVGLIKSVTEDPSGDPGSRIEQVLLDYGFPASP
jgi:hypothetical protein